MRARIDLESMLARMAESMANATLRLDQASHERLAALEGRAVQVESTFPAQVCCVRVRDARIEVLPGLADSPDAVARGQAQDLLAWFAAPRSRAAERVEIRGDAAVLADLAGVFKALAPAGFTPPIGGDDLLGAAELAAATLRSAAEGIAGAWRDATVERFVNRGRFGDFQDGIENLRIEVERLAARVSALEPAGGKGPATAADPRTEPGGAPDRDAAGAPGPEETPE